MRHPPDADDTASPRPNALRSGSVRRTMWPPSAGTHRWTRQFGNALLCVRHRDDPAGLRRVVTVELVVGTVGGRSHAPRKVLKDAALYPISVKWTDRGLRALLKAHGAQWDAIDLVWYVRGKVIDRLGLHDQILVVPARKPRMLR